MNRNLSERTVVFKCIRTALVNKNSACGFYAKLARCGKSVVICEDKCRSKRQRNDDHREQEAQYCESSVFESGGFIASCEPRDTCDKKSDDQDNHAHREAPFHVSGRNNDHSEQCECFDQANDCSCSEPCGFFACLCERKHYLCQFDNDKENKEYCTHNQSTFLFGFRVSFLL